MSSSFIKLFTTVFYIGYLPFTPGTIASVIGGAIYFFLFRAFDMFKIYPADKFEVFPGSIGIMMDDIVAGLYTNLIMHIALSIKTGTAL